MYCCSLIIRLTQVYCKAFWWARDSYVDEKWHPRKQMALCWSYLQQRQTNTGITDAFVIAIACLFVCWQNLFQEILLEKYFVQQNLMYTCFPVYYRSCYGRWTREHSHWWRSGVQRQKWFLSTRERVHLPGLPLWSAASPICKLQLGPDHRRVPTSPLFRPQSGSHTGDRSRYANV